MSWEVRTMKSATSSSKSWFYPTLWKKNMARFWPVWALYGLVWLVALPLNLMTNYRGGGNWGGLDEGANHFANYTVLEYAGELSVILSVGFAILAAMAVFSYLYASRSVGMLHALPLRREGLFLTNYLSGLLFLLLPNLAVFLLALAAEVFAGTVVFSSLFTWLVVVSLFGLFFYSFAVFCAMFTRPRAGPARLLCGSQWPGRRAVLGLQPYGRGISLRLHQRCLAGEAGRLAHPGAAALRGLSRPV